MFSTCPLFVRVVVLTTDLAMTSDGMAQKWTRFQGPNGSGVSDAKTGKERWRQTETIRSSKKHKVNSFATSRPAVDAVRVYHVWQSTESSGLLAFTHDGARTWKFPLDAFSEGHGGGT